LIVTPVLINSARFPPPKIHGYAVELESRTGGTSGRFAVARYAARLFPRAAAAFIARVKSEGLEPASHFELGPYATDAVRYPDGLVAEFTTPANTRGLGTEEYLDPSQDAIRGIAVLYNSDPEEPAMAILRVRLGSSMRREEAAILRLNTECMHRTEGC
jgi:hypothetical protein